MASYNNYFKVKIILALFTISTLMSGCESSKTINNSVPPVSTVPQLTINNAEFDFGIAPQHSKLSHIFWLHSTGTDTLRIVKIVPG